MKLLKKSILLVVLCVTFAAILCMQTFAAGIDGLETNLSTDKKEYSKGEVITATLTVRNTGAETIKNISLSHLLPDGYEFEDEDDAILTTESLAPGESLKLKVKYEPSKAAASDVVKIILYSLAGVVGVGAVGGVTVFLVIRKKRVKPLLSILLCLAMLSPFALNIEAASAQSRISVSCDVNVEKTPLKLSAVVAYDAPSDAVRNVNVEFDDLMYDTSNGIYYATDYMQKLTGKILDTSDIVSATCTVSDVNGNVLLSKTFDVQPVWEVEDFGMVVGMNDVTISLTYEGGQVYAHSVKVNNICEENMSSLDIDKGDDDDDGVLNFIEVMYGTNKNKADTDGDGLSDYYEMAMLATSPTVKDTDGNSVSDADEDLDGDTISNIEEINTYKTNPSSTDSDGDSLKDDEELFELKTDPSKADSDKDGRSDYWETLYGFDPLVPDEIFPEKVEGKVPENVTVESEGFVHITEIIGDEILNEDTPGYIGEPPMYIELEEGKSANIAVKYDPEQLGEGETPALYFYNIGTQSYEEIESTINENGEVTATVTKKGSYILLNHRFIDEVIENDIFRPSDHIENGSIDAVFVIDRSASMDTNDPNNIRKEVTKEFINKLRLETDRAAIVQFNAIGELVMPLTNDKEALCNAVDAIENSDGGGCAGTDENAGTNGSAGIRAALTALAESTADYKYIFFLTDGVDTHVAEDYGDELGTTGLTGEAKSLGIIIHTVGLVGTDEVDTDLLKRVAAGTGGNYYLATVGEDAEVNEELVEIYEELESVTIDRHLDSNNDGISDYYTKLICEGKLKSAIGIDFLFGTALYEDIQLSDDYDVDGVRNGDELEVFETDMGVFVKIHSYPYMKDSDLDGLSDMTEREIATSPMKKNSFADIGDVDWLTESEYFTADIYLDIYEGSAFERGSVFIGNAFFGTTLDQTNLYKKALVEYFSDIDEKLMSEAKIEKLKQLTLDHICDSFDEAAKLMLKSVEEGNHEKATGIANFIQDGLSDIIDVIKLPNDVMEAWGIKDGILKLMTYTKAMDLANCTDMVEYIDGRLFELYVFEIDGDNYFFQNLITVWENRRAAYVEHIADLGKSVSRTSKIYKGASTALKVADGVTKVLDATVTIAQTYSNYAETVSCFEVMENNIQILECIIARSDNIYLTNAARELLTYINFSYREDTAKLVYCFEGAEALITDAILNKAHEQIAKAGIPGAIIELTRTIGNLVFNIDEMSQKASRTIALTKTADILAKHFKDQLEAGYAIKNDQYWIAYADYSISMLETILHIGQIRKNGELEFYSWQDSQEIKDSCQSVSNECDRLIEKYNKIFYEFCYSSN